MPDAYSTFPTGWMQRALPTFWPAERRVSGTQSGLFCIEGDAGSGWRLEGLAFSLADAFAIGERLHAAPSPFARLYAYAVQARGRRPRPVYWLPDSYRVQTEGGWQGRLFQAAVRNTPFALDVAADGIFRPAGWQRALSTAQAAIAEGRSVVLLGQAGAGKSTFLADLGQQLVRAGVRAVTLHGMAPLPPDLQADAVLLDDAGRAREELLSSLLQCGRPLVLTGPAQSRLLLAAAAWLPEVVRLEPLSAHEAASFIAGRLARAGRSPQWADPEAVLGLVQYSGGVLRALILLAGAAAFLADLECSSQLRLRHVEHASAIAEAGGAQVRPEGRPAGVPLRSRLRHARSRFGTRAWRGAWLPPAGAGLALVIGLYAAVPWHSAKPDTARFDPAVLDRESGTGDHVDMASRSIGAAAPSTTAAQPAPVLANTAQRPPDAGALASGEPRESADRDAESRLASAGDPDDARSDQALGGGFDGNVSVAGKGAPSPDEPDRAASTEPLAVANARPGFADERALLGSFKGPVNNETLHLSGKLSLEIVSGGTPGVIRARFHAWDGLLGTGELLGTISTEGRIALSGQLLVGRNPFLCNLTGVIRGDQVTGSARFVRPWGGAVALSSFNLLRS